MMVPGAFLQKSLSEADTVVYLLRLNFLGTVRRKPFWDAYLPTHLFAITPRPRFVNGGSDACEYGCSNHKTLSHKQYRL
jgi:hypothetical protein